MSLVLSPNFSPLVYHLEWDPSREVESGGTPSVPEIPAEVKKAVRDLLRFGGHKPSGRGRPASESLLKALQDGRFPTIHPVVDFFNLVSLESGLPISVLDEDKMTGGTFFRLGAEKESYVFNPSGQELTLTGLLVVCDGKGPTGSPVKDAQRTKIDTETRRFLVVVWGTGELPSLLESTARRIEQWASDAGVKLNCTSLEQDVAP